MDRGKVGCEGMCWVNLAQDRGLLNTAMNLRVP